MSGPRWAIGAFAATFVACTGCVSCDDKCYRKALENSAACEMPLQSRTQLYVYMIHGVTPTTDDGLEALRMKLCERGFAKSAVSELACAPLIACEIKKTLKCEPEAKFVLLGYDVGSAAAVSLARELTAKGVPVEAVVLLDPVGCQEASGVRTLVISNGSAKDTGRASRRKPSPVSSAANDLVSHVVVSDAGHFKLPAHPGTVEAVTDLLTDIAARNYQDPGDSVTSWSYQHAPEMHRPAGGTHAPEWNFLADTGETPAGINPSVAAPLVRQYVPPPVSTFAGPVVIPK
jgi:hypothetical protein